MPGCCCGLGSVGAVSCAGWPWLQPGPCPMASLVPKECSQLPLEPRGPTLGPKPPKASVGRGHHSTLRSKQPSLVYQMYLLLLGGRDSLVKNIKDKILSEPGSLRFVLSKTKIFYVFPLHSICVFLSIMYLLVCCDSLL